MKINKNSLTVINLSIVFILLVLFNLPYRDLSYVEERYRGVVVEFIAEMEYHGINVPKQKSWTLKTDPMLLGAGFIGLAEGKDDDRHVYIKLSPLLQYRSELQIKSVIWHELSHDVFNLKHGSTLLMKPKETIHDGKLFYISKELLIQYLKNKQNSLH